MANMLRHILYYSSFLLLTACSVGPNYDKPIVQMPDKFKEAPTGWKYAQPRDAEPKGNWWHVFNDPELDHLIVKLNVNNQNIAQISAQYQNALFLIDETRAAYWPVLSILFSGTRTGPSGTLHNLVSGSTVDASAPYNNYLLQPTATWTPDIFGVVRRAVEAGTAGAQATAAQLAFTQLSLQSTLAQTYFQLRALDLIQENLDAIEKGYKGLLHYTTNQYKSGVVSNLEVTNAEIQYETAHNAALDNKIARAQYEHAIAVLVGENAPEFSITKRHTPLQAPHVPLELPSTLLERRPDIAQAERLMAQANAQIGVAIAAFYPVVTISAADGYNSSFWRNFLTHNSNLWSYGAQLAETLLDGGLRDATVKAARATYNQNVASYKQTVLAALQNVEDNLVALRVLNKEVSTQQKVVKHNSRVLDITTNRYHVGTVDDSQILTQQIALEAAKQNEAALISRQMVAAVGLIQALGGSW